MFNSMFDNIAIVALCLLLVAQGFKKYTLQDKTSLKVRISLGIIFGVFGIILMWRSIFVTDTVIIDLRNISLLCSAMLGGTIAMGVTGLIIVFYRLIYFGVNTASITAAVVTLIICIVGAAIVRIKISKAKKFIYLFLTMMLISNVELVLLINNKVLIMQIMPIYWVAYIFGAILAYFGLEYIDSVNFTLREMEYYRIIAENLTDMVSTHKPGGIYLYASPSTEQLTGYKPAELIGKNAYSLIHPDDISGLKSIEENLNQIDNPLRVFRIRRKDGNYIWVESAIKWLMNKDGLVKETIVATRDISNRVKVEQELKESENKYRLLVNSMNDIIFTLDKEFVYTGIYGNWTEKNGLSEELFLEKTIRDSVGRKSSFIHELANKRAMSGEHVIYDWTMKSEENTFYYQNMLSPIKNQAGEVTGIVGVGRDISERIRMEKEWLRKNQELKLQTEEAINANRLKSRFLANMSHELRTPLNSIIGFTNRVIKKCENELPIVQFENLKIVKDEAQHLLILINDLLDYSKIASGKMNTHITEFNLIDLINEISAMVRFLIEEKSLIYKLSLFSELYMPMISDRMKIKQIILNLIANAIKFSNKGTIELIVENSDGYYRISIKDEGIGIVPGDFKFIFDEFSQVDEVFFSKTPGTGLGLSNSKRYIEMLGGEIYLASEIGKGSCFTIYIPKGIENSKVVP